MAKEIKYKNSDKRFLSAHPDQNGNVVWGCMMSEYADGEFSLECDLQIGDCSKWVNLEFGVYRYDNQGKPILPSINKRLRKLDKLINSLLKLRSSLEECKKIIKEGR